MANNTPATTATTSDTTSSTSDIDPCLLKRLPAELRTTIFEYAITEDKPIGVAFEHTPGGPYIPVLGDLATYIHITGFQLAQTCHQFRAEVLPLLCTVNAIVLDLPPDRLLPGSSVPAFLSKTPHLIINITDLERATGRVLYDAGKMHVKQHAGRITKVSGSGSLRGRCLCEIRELAAGCEGKDCVREFVKEFDGQGFHEMLCYSKRETKKKQFLCEKCGKAKTPGI